MLSYKYEELEAMLDKEQWLELHQVDMYVSTYPSESGMDRELDSDIESWIDDLYVNYIEGAEVLCKTP